MVFLWQKSRTEESTKAQGRTSLLAFQIKEHIMISRWVIWNNYSPNSTHITTQIYGFTITLNKCLHKKKQCFQTGESQSDNSTQTRTLKATQDTLEDPAALVPEIWIHYRLTNDTIKIISTKSVRETQGPKSLPSLKKLITSHFVNWNITNN